MTAHIVLVSANSFLRLAVEVILRGGGHQFEHVETIAGLSSVASQRQVDLVLFDSALLGSSVGQPRLHAIAAPVLAIDTGETPLSAIAAKRFAAVLRASEDGRIDITSLQRHLPAAIAGCLSEAPPNIVQRQPAGQSQQLAHKPRDLLLIGASTGGPEALIALFSVLGKPSFPVVVGIHMPSDQTAAFADHLSQRTGLTVKETGQGPLLPIGDVAVLKGGANYRIARGPSGIAIRRSLAEAGPYRPSLDLLFGSAAEAGLVCDAVVLSGMGADGAVGAAAIATAGGRVLVQQPNSCVVGGMPAATLAACNAAQALTPASIAAKLTQSAYAVRQMQPATQERA